MSNRILSLALLGCCARGIRAVDVTCGAGQTCWTNATDAMATMEDIVQRQAQHLQRAYVEVTEMSSGAECRHQLMCDSRIEAWTSARREDQFLNRELGTVGDGSCTRLDRDKKAIHIVPPLTGREYGSVVDSTRRRRRRTYKPPAGTKAYPPAGNGELECAWPYLVCPSDTGRPTLSTAAKNTNECIRNPESRAAFLSRHNCTSASNKQKCTVNKQQWGVSMPTQELDATTQEISKNEICASNRLLESSALGDYTIRKVAQKYPQTGWHYSGFQATGMYRNWPSIYQCRTEAVCSGCSDARFRGWYAGSASGPKDVVIVIDRSGSMRKEDRMASAITAAKWVVNTFSATDYATIVSFSSDVDSFSPQLKQMTAENKAAMKAYISLLEANGGTNMKDAFNKAFDVLDSSTTTQEMPNPNSSGCSKVVLFLSDGQPSNNQDPQEAVKMRNGGRSWMADDDEARVAKNHARIFTYAFGDNAPTALMKKLSCENSGIYMKIRDSDSGNLKQIMASYFVYLAAGLKGAGQGSASPATWNDQFEDGQGMGWSTGACARVYDTTKTPVQLFSVICLAMPVEQLKRMSGYDAAWQRAMNARKVCPKLDFSTSELESLRAIASSDSVCADDDMEEIAGIAAGAAVGGLAFLAILACVCKKCKCKCKRREKSPPAVQPPQPTHAVQMAVFQQQPHQVQMAQPVVIQSPEHRV